ncbi:hypothetical protein PLESTF_001675500 [Pleodorina starrii]|nr:hypothetical protein PLESTM_001548000 [Pleodorina starrii]GLC75703.1 hypothetical protein PLESTF_001675500 [Pleodorina starrii]
MEGILLKRVLCDLEQSRHIFKTAAVNCHCRAVSGAGPGGSPAPQQPAEGTHTPHASHSRPPLLQDAVRLQLIWAQEAGKVLASASGAARHQHSYVVAIARVAADALSFVAEAVDAHQQGAHQQFCAAEVVAVAQSLVTHVAGALVEYLRQRASAMRRMVPATEDASISAAAKEADWLRDWAASISGLQEAYGTNSSSSSGSSSRLPEAAAPPAAVQQTTPPLHPAEAAVAAALTIVGAAYQQQHARPATATSGATAAVGGMWTAPHAGLAPFIGGAAGTTAGQHAGGTTTAASVEGTPRSYDDLINVIKRLFNAIQRLEAAADDEETQRDAAVFDAGVQVFHLSSVVHGSMVAEMWGVAIIRCAFFKLLSHAIRRVVAPSSSSSRLITADQLRSPLEVLKLLSCYLYILPQRITAHPGGGALSKVHIQQQQAVPVAAEVSQLLVSTDMLTCLTRLFAVLERAAELLARVTVPPPAPMLATAAPAAASAAAQQEPAAAPAAFAAAIPRASLAAAATGTALTAEEEELVAALSNIDAAMARGTTSPSVMLLLLLFSGFTKGGGDLGHWSPLICQLFEQLKNLVHLSVHAVMHHDRVEFQQDAPYKLRGAILSSRMLEHAARAAALLWRAAALHGAARRTECEILASVHRALEVVMSVADSATRPLAVWAETVLSGPCMQHFLLLHTVGTLCAVDGGPDYGLPGGARLPPLVKGTNTTVCDDGTSGLQVIVSRLSAQAFYCWARNSRARPVSDRVLRALCERAVAAVNTPHGGAALHQSNSSGSGGGGGGAGGDTRPPPVYVVDPLAGLELSLAALFCASTLTAGTSRKLWAPTVRAAVAALVLDQRGAPQRVGPLQLLMQLRLPTVSGVWTGM